MNNAERLKAVEDFLEWLESDTYYKIGQDVQSDYGDGESNFYSIGIKELLKDYREALEEGEQ